MPFVCPLCDHVQYPSPTCSDCDHIIQYQSQTREALENAVNGDFWAALPNYEPQITMGEGTTPIVQLDRVSSKLGFTVYAKLESLNPTSSFKDRGSALCVSTVADPSTSYEAIITASSGNTATSIAAYAARAGVPCAILVPDHTSASKLTQAISYGATVHTLDGTVSDCFERAQAISNDRILNATSVYSANPYVACADRTVAFELVQDLNKVPDWVSVPVGAGPLLGGAYDGFLDLKRNGITDDLPAMLCAQADGCHPVVEAFNNDRPVTTWEKPISTDIGPIADPLRGYAEDGEYTRKAVLKSKGDAVAVSDEMIYKWKERLAEWEGIYAEPASAASVAALASSDAVDRGNAVALITGHGLKGTDNEELTVESDGSVSAVRNFLLS